MLLPTLPPPFRTAYATDDTRTCYACGSDTTESVSRCPACGSARIRSGRAVRRLGWVLVVLGGALVAGMGALSLVIGRIIYFTDRPGATTRFTGTPEDIALIYGVFGVVAALGAACVFGGVWQIRYGRPNRAVMAVALVVLLALLGVRALIRMGHLT